MKKYLWIYICFLPFFPLRSEENLVSLSQQAEALGEARDYLAASHLYEQMLSHSLPAWQHARILYNLGVLQLAQGHPAEALTLFQKIVPFDLSLPLFGRHLLLNEGIAYFHEAEKHEIDQQSIFIQQSLRLFDQAQILDCQLQEKEHQTHFPFSCQTDSLLAQWIKTARLKLYTLFQQKRQDWIEQANVESLATFLSYQLQEWMQRFQALKMQKSFSSSDQTSFLAYFQDQAASLMPIWNALQQKEFSLEQKEAFAHALDFYFSARQALNRQDVDSALNNWKQGREALIPLSFQIHKDLQQIKLNYEILLLQDPITLSTVKDLLAQFESLQVETEHSRSLKQVQDYLRLSVEALQNHDSLAARFFLLAGFQPADSLSSNQKKTPATVLRQAIQQASRTLQLLLSSEMISKESAYSSLILKILKRQQSHVLTQAAPLIPSILEEQDLHFHQEKNANLSCQQFPWEQVIPLYSRGYQFAEKAQQQLDKNPLDAAVIAGAQEETIKNWQQALNLILNPPQPNRGSAEPQKFTETLRLIQEMSLEDQPQPEQATEEMHSW